MSNSDTDLRAVISIVRINMNNMCDDFEGSAGFLLPVCPYAKHQNERGSSTSNIRGTNIYYDTIRGKYYSKTDVDIRWHKRDEYAELSPDQKHGLYEWQKSKYGKAFINQS